MESYKQKMKRKVREAKLRHESKYQQDNKLGNAIMAIIAILGGVSATITFSYIIYKLLI